MRPKQTVGVFISYLTGGLGAGGCCGGDGVWWRGEIEFRRRSLPRGDKLTCSSSGGTSGLVHDGRRS